MRCVMRSLARSAARSSGVMRLEALRDSEEVWMASAPIEALQWRGAAWRSERLGGRSEERAGEGERVRRAVDEATLNLQGARGLPGGEGLRRQEG